jgi:hypothetical protein
MILNVLNMTNYPIAVAETDELSLYASQIFIFLGGGTKVEQYGTSKKIIH